MLVNRRKIDIKYPDCSTKNLSLAFYDRINITKNEAIAEINELTGGDDLEISRIQMAIEWHLANNSQDEDFAEFAPFDLSVLEDKEPTFIELMLSSSLHSSYFGEDHFEAGNLLEAFDCLARASETLGLAKGYKLAEDFKDRETQIKKMILSDKAINARHNQPGGSRDKQNQIRAIWATGKYTSRDICAEQECASLVVSFATARKALRNTPDPQTT